MKTKTVCDADASDLSKEMVGKSIVRIDEEKSTIALNDGTVLELESDFGCCAWFEVMSMKAIDVEDNVITAVNNEDSTLKNGDRSSGAFDIVVLSRQKEIARVQIDGDPTSGYYCSSVRMVVRKINDD